MTIGGGGDDRQAITSLIKFVRGAEWSKQDTPSPSQPSTHTHYDTPPSTQRTHYTTSPASGAALSVGVL